MVSIRRQLRSTTCLRATYNLAFYGQTPLSIRAVHWRAHQQYELRLAGQDVADQLQALILSSHRHT
jgi:hypothetical protein